VLRVFPALCVDGLDLFIFELVVEEIELIFEVGHLVSREVLDEEFMRVVEASPQKLINLGFMVVGA